MNIKYVAILTLLTAVLSAAVTRYYFPQVEFKNTETVKEVVKNDVRTVVKEVIRPDGTKEIVTEITDKSIKRETSTSETMISKKNQWMFGLGVRANPLDFKVYYDAQIQRRIMGPVFAGVYLSTDKSIGVSLGLEF